MAAVRGSAGSDGGGVSAGGGEWREKMGRRGEGGKRRNVKNFIWQCGERQRSLNVQTGRTRKRCEKDV